MKKNYISSAVFIWMTVICMDLILFQPVCAFTSSKLVSKKELQTRYHQFQKPAFQKMQHFWFSNGVSINPDSCGDVMILQSGEEIVCKVKVISDIEISYEVCEEDSNKLKVAKRQHVFLIKYSNGSKELINQTNSGQNLKMQNIRGTNADSDLPQRPTYVYSKNTDVILFRNGNVEFCQIKKIEFDIIYYRVFRKGIDFNNSIKMQSVAKYSFNGKVSIVEE